MGLGARVPASLRAPACWPGSRSLPPAALVSCAVSLCWAPGATLPLLRPLSPPSPRMTRPTALPRSLGEGGPDREAPTSSGAWSTAAQLLSGSAGRSQQERARSDSWASPQVPVCCGALGGAFHNLRAVQLSLRGKCPTGKRMNQHPRDGFAPSRAPGCPFMEEPGPRGALHSAGSRPMPGPPGPGASCVQRGAQAPGSTRADGRRALPGHARCEAF